MIPNCRLVMMMGDTPVDITQWWLASEGWSIKRARGSELAEYPVSSFTFSLDNSDGRFTPDNAASPYYPYLTRGRSVTMQTYVPAYGGYAEGWLTRFSGSVVDEAVTWDTIQTVSQVTLTAQGPTAAYGLRTLQSWCVEQIRKQAPVAYWPLTDTQAPARPLVGFARLDPAQYGTGGELRWAEGTGPATDQTGALMCAPADTSNGLLLTGQPVTVPTSFTLIVIANPTAPGTVVEMAWGSYALAVRWTGATFALVERTLGASGPVETTLGTHDGVGTSSTRFVRVDVGVGVASIDPSGLTATRAASPDQPVTVSIGGSSTRPAGPDLVTATISHVAILAGLPGTSWASGLLGGLLPATTILSTMLGWIGAPTVVTADSTPPSLPIPRTLGKTVAEVIKDLGMGTGARIFVKSFETSLTWRGEDFAPTPVSVSMEDIEPDVRWTPDDSTDLRHVTVSLRGGGAYTADSGRTTGHDLSIVGVWDDDWANQGRADWLVAQPRRPRLSGVTVDLLTLPDAVRWLYLQPGDQLALTSVPPQITAGVQVVEGIDESGSHDSWALALSTSPWPYGEAWVCDDATYGAVDSWPVL